MLDKGIIPYKAKFKAIVAELHQSFGDRVLPMVDKFYKQVSSKVNDIKVWMLFDRRLKVAIKADEAPTRSTFDRVRERVTRASEAPTRSNFDRQLGKGKGGFDGR